MDRVGEWTLRGSESEDDRVARIALVASSLAIAALSTVWYVSLFALGRPVSAAIPLTYQLVTIVGVVRVGQTKRFDVFRRRQIAMILILPAALQWTLGGFVSSGAVLLWGSGAAVGAQIFSPRPWRWLFAYGVMIAFSAAIDPWLRDSVEQLPGAASVALFSINLLGVVIVIVVVVRSFILQRDKARTELETERARSEMLLLNVLPESIAARLKSGESTIADGADAVTVLFADIVDFTPKAAVLAPDDVVTLLNDVFTCFDALCAEYDLEKIKTVGDAYMVVAGVPRARDDHAAVIVEFGERALQAVAALSHDIEVRIGVDTGPVVAGVIGASKFSYDLWGDTVNTASRMEAHGLPGRIHVTGRVCDAVREHYRCESRGVIDIKGKGPMETFLVVLPSRSEEPTSRTSSVGAGDASPGTDRHPPAPPTHLTSTS
jgi:adenylate cyclase